MVDDGAGGTPGHKPRPGEAGRLDLRDVKRLVHLMDLHGLAEIELEDEGRKVRLRRGGPGAAQPLAAVPVPLTLAPLLAANGVSPGYAPAAAPPAGPAAAPGTPKGTPIRSPMVGTFYRAPSPEAAPFAEVGDTIRKDTVVCVIEAMKVMNEIKAEVEGEVLAVLVQNGEAVEFDQPLFLVKPAPGVAPAE